MTGLEELVLTATAEPWLATTESFLCLLDDFVWHQKKAQHSLSQDLILDERK